MKITVLDSTNYAYNIDCDDPAILGPWLLNVVRKLMTDRSSFQYSRIQIWPQTEAEIALVGKDWQYRSIEITQENVLEWAKQLTDLSAELGEHERNKIQS